MKLFLKKLTITLLAMSVIALALAEHQGYFAVILSSWRNAITILGAIGMLMIGYSGFDFSFKEKFNLSEMSLEIIVAILIIIGVSIANNVLVFYGLAAVLELLWLDYMFNHLESSNITVGDKASHTNHLYRPKLF